MPFMKGLLCIVLFSQTLLAQEGDLVQSGEVFLNLTIRSEASEAMVSKDGKARNLQSSREIFKVPVVTIEMVSTTQARVNFASPIFFHLLDRSDGSSRGQRALRSVLIDFSNQKLLPHLLRLARGDIINFADMERQEIKQLMEDIFERNLSQVVEEIDRYNRKVPEFFIFEGFAFEVGLSEIGQPRGAFVEKIDLVVFELADMRETMTDPTPRFVEFKWIKDLLSPNRSWLDPYLTAVDYVRSQREKMLWGEMSKEVTWEEMLELRSNVIDFQEAIMCERIY